ncbi:MAG: NifU family protein [Acidobacteria bacterium]|nr:NifU family protein [Acidobacteriota bacterium]
MDTGNVTHEEIERRKHDLADLMGIVAAEVAKDGGTASLGRVAYAEGTVEVVLSGACGSCTLTGATLEDGIKRVLTQRLDWVRRVDGIVEDDPDATGTGGWTPRATSR